MPIIVNINYKPMHAPCIKSPHAKSHMHIVTCNSTTIFFPYFPLSKLPLDFLCLLVSFLSSWSSLFEIDKKIEQKLSIVSQVSFYSRGLMSLPFLFFFLSFSFILSLISLACIFLSLHLHILQFSFIP